MIILGFVFEYNILAEKYWNKMLHLFYEKVRKNTYLLLQEELTDEPPVLTRP